MTWVVIFPSYLSSKIQGVGVSSWSLQMRWQRDMVIGDWDVVGSGNLVCLVGMGCLLVSKTFGGTDIDYKFC